MSDGTFHLKVFSGRGLEVEAFVRSARVPSEVGELGFLANHREYVGLLSTGFVEYEKEGVSAQQQCLVSGGICTFKDNVLTLLADTVDLPESYNESLLSEDLQALQMQLQSLSLFDPEWEFISRRVARIEALRAMAAQ